MLVNTHSNRVHVFTYGSLMYPQVWERVVSGKYRSDELQISGFQRKSIRGEIYPALVAQSGGAVLGRVYWHVRENDLVRLDFFEGDAYRRQVIPAAFGGNTVEAQAYLWRPSMRARLSDNVWDPEHFEKVGLKPFLHRYVGAKRQ